MLINLEECTYNNDEFGSEIVSHFKCSGEGLVKTQSQIIFEDTVLFSSTASYELISNNNMFVDDSIYINFPIGQGYRMMAEHSIFKLSESLSIPILTESHSEPRTLIIGSNKVHIFFNPDDSDKSINITAEVCPGDALMISGAITSPEIYDQGIKTITIPIFEDYSASINITIDRFHIASKDISERLF